MSVPYHKKVRESSNSAVCYKKSSRNHSTDPKYFQHLRNSTTENYWAKVGIENRKKFPEIIDKAESITNFLLSVPCSSWNTFTSKQTVNLLMYNHKQKGTYYKTVKKVYNNFYTVGQLLLNDYSIKQWNPYLQKFNVINCVKDRHGVYEA